MRRTGFVSLLIVVLSLLAPNGAHADVVSKDDVRGDAPARLDIAKVTYRHAPARVSVRIVVPDLERAGRAELIVGSASPSDVAWVAIASIRPDGSLRKRFVERGNLGDTPRKCSFEAQWNASKHFVFISMPRSCASGAGEGDLYIRADMSAFEETARDSAPAALHLSRG